MTLQRALLATVGLAILAGMIPAAMVLNRRLADALEARARADLALAPRVLVDRNAANADALMMHAKDLSRADGIAVALAQNDRRGAQAFVDSTRARQGDIAFVIGPNGTSWSGPPVDEQLVEETRRGRMPVAVQRGDNTVHNIALAPVEYDGQWVGAVGIVSPYDNSSAGILSGITRSDVLIVTTTDGMIAGSTLDSLTSAQVVAAMQSGTPVNDAIEVHAGAHRRLAIIAPLGDVAFVIFTRTMSDELAVLPELRRVAWLSALGALIVALSLGAWLAGRVARPVQQLSEAASALANGEFDAPLPSSRIQEVERVSITFDEMRQALAARLAEVQRANDALTDRNTRLVALQADLMQRDRLTATGRLVAQLAHEIRNPVANLRNCLELIRRRVTDDAEALEFTDLAIDELLRMHELAEQMLDVNRPQDDRSHRCRPVLVAHDVVRLSTLGALANSVQVTSEIANDVEVALAPDALKQILQNIVQNAREAMKPKSVTAVRISEPVEIAIAWSDGEWSDVAIHVTDHGPGIPEALKARIFDPFFTTKDAVHGVGLGLFVAEGLVRTAGGRLTAGNRAEGGAWFRIELPLALADASELTRETEEVPG